MKLFDEPSYWQFPADDPYWLPFWGAVAFGLIVTGGVFFLIGLFKVVFA